MVSGAVYLFGTLFYLCFGSGVRQPWATQVEPKRDEEKELEPVVSVDGGDK